MMRRYDRLAVALALAGAIAIAAPVFAAAAERQTEGTPTLRQAPPQKPPVPLAPPPEFLPDLVVSAASVTMQCLPGGLTATIVATVKNQSPKGTADLSKIPWQIILEADWGFTGGEGFLEKSSVMTVKPQVGGPKTLKPGDSWTGTLTITGIPKVNVAEAKKAGKTASEYVFKVTADPGNGVAETDEKNNVKLIYHKNPCP